MIWRKRWCVIRGSTLLLMGKQGAARALRTLKLNAHLKIRRVVKDNKFKHALALYTLDDVIYLAMETGEDQEAWVNALVHRSQQLVKDEKEIQARIASWAVKVRLLTYTNGEKR